MLPSDQASTLAIAALAIPYGALVVSPGPNFLMVSHAGLTASRRSAFLAALGVALGAALLALAAHASSQVIGASRPIRIGAIVLVCVFLIYVGARLLWQGVNGRENASEASGYPNRAHFWFGLVTAATNPATAGFFVVHAVRRPGPVALTEPQVAAIVFAIALGWFGLVAVCAGAPAIQAFYRHRRRGLSACGGVTLILMALGSLSALPV